ncbi:MAG: phosphodiester glycosidase family protein [Christensenellaceae bacterium]|nr:phosphodiester glycosidase family protein [Christensenellaceae bacterium]
MRKLLTALLILTLLVPAALAETTWEPLPLDDLEAIPHIADPANFTESSYEDETLSVTVEHIWVDDARFNVARVKIVDPSQLRTGVQQPYGKKDNKISTMAQAHNAVVAIGGDYFSKDNYGYVMRMQYVMPKRTNPSSKRDMLLIDANGDFHFALQSNLDPAYDELLDPTHEPVIVNTFNFGPALVVDGKLRDAADYSYYTKYNLGGKEPRSAIGQLGPLEYLLVVVDGRDAADSNGCTAAALAQFMYDQGCINAYNLDGGNSALMYFNGENYSQKSFKAERAVSDFIYFGTLIDFGLDGAEGN